MLGIIHVEHLAGSRLWLTVLSYPNYGARMSKIGRPAASRLPRKRLKPLPAQKNLDLFSGTQDHKAALEALRESEARYRQIVELTPDAILIESLGKIVFVNTAAKKLFRETSQARLVDRFAIDLTPVAHQESLARQLAQLGASNSLLHTDELLQRLDGSTFDASVRRVRVVHDGQAATHTVVRDISERKKREHQLSYQATHDALTGATNRDSLILKLRDAIHQADRHGFGVWVIFIDLDRFKQINDQFGHAYGDQLLQVVAGRLSNSLRRDDVLARYGGDEFVLILRGGSDDYLTPQIIERLVASVSEPLAIEGLELTITCSVGISTYPVDGRNAEELILQADTAMYLAKGSGHNRYQFYNEAIDVQLYQRAIVETELQHALEKREFYLVYQPQVSLKTGRISGVEALLRWANPRLGELMPEQFLPLAEKTALINTIGAWVVNEAVQQAASWEREGLGALRIAVNLCARQIDMAGLLHVVKTALDDAHLLPQRLELELTETLMMSDVKRTQRLLQELDRLGVQVAMDDFGTGYSSLVHLQRMPLHCLKIDKDIVRALSDPDDDSAEPILGRLVTLAHSLRLRVVAEGVENQEQLNILRRHNCDEIQGYMHSAPQTANSIAAVLRKHLNEDWRGD